MQQRFLSIAFCLAILCLGAAGCGQQQLPEGLDAVHPVEVTVTYNGNPLPEADVYFVPADGDQRFAAVGQTNANGKATLYTLNKYKGAKAGPHNISVSKWEVFETGEFETNEAGEKVPVTDRKTVVPKKYADHKTSGLTETVEPGTNSFTLELTDG
jgi:hypothetical protein